MVGKRALFNASTSCGLWEDCPAVQRQSTPTGGLHAPPRFYILPQGEGRRASGTQVLLQSHLGQRQSVLVPPSSPAFFSLPFLGLSEPGASSVLASSGRRWTAACRSHGILKGRVYSLRFPKLPQFHRRTAAFWASAHLTLQRLPGNYIM